MSQIESVYNVNKKSSKHKTFNVPFFQRGKDGVVFAVEKIVTSKLYEKGANKRIFNVDRHVGMAASGLYPDTRQLAETAANEASNYR